MGCGEESLFSKRSLPRKTILQNQTIVIIPRQYYRKYHPGKIPVHSRVRSVSGSYKYSTHQYSRQRVLHFCRKAKTSHCVSNVSQGGKPPCFTLVCSANQLNFPRQYCRKYHPGKIPVHSRVRLVSGSTFPIFQSNPADSCRSNHKHTVHGR